jgi:hypothetical protein
MSSPIGQSLDLTFTCKDRSLALINATTLNARVEKPDGTFTTYTYGVDANLVLISVGVYRLTITPDMAGDWVFRGDFTYTSGGTTVKGATRDVPRTIQSTHFTIT